MKYIIDLPNGKPIMFMDGEHMNTIVPSENEMYVFNGAIGAAVVKLTPYADEIERARKAGQDEAWEAVRRILSDCEFSPKELFLMFGDASPYAVIENFSVQEVIKKISEYEKEKDEIHVGDEVEPLYNCGAYTEPWVVIKIVGDIIIGFGLKQYGHNMNKNRLKKTGRHFDEIETLLEKMRNDE